MLIATVIYERNGTSFRKLFDKFKSVKIVANNKLFSIEPSGVLTVESYQSKDERWNDCEKHVISVPSPFIYNKGDRFLMRQEGKGFDYFGATFGQYLGLGFQDGNKWFDAELVTKYFQCCLFDEFVELNCSKMSISKLYDITDKLQTKQAIEAQNRKTVVKPVKRDGDSSNRKKPWADVIRK
jgi:hypothetical protein